MSEKKSQIQETIDALKRQRDELALQIHLGKAEAKEEFEKAQARLDQLSQEFEPLRDAVEESAEIVFAALKLVGEELMSSFERVRKSLR